MRRFLLFVVIAGLGILYLWQKDREEQSPAPAQQTSAAAQEQPRPREIYEHDWAKRSIDKARDVAQKARAQTEEAQRQ